MAQNKVRHSPSIGLYRDWASLLNRDDMNTIFHPPLQHNIVISPLQWQCFCHSPKDCPSLLQSVTSAVIRLNSNIVTPLCILRTILAFAKPNYLSRCSVQMNLVFGLNRCLKCDVSAHFENAKDTCSTNPKNALAWVIFFGAGKFLIDSVIAAAGFISSFVKVKPT